MSIPSSVSDSIDEALLAARAEYGRRRPLTLQAHNRAGAVMPGANTRTVLYHPPFPLRIERCWDGMLRDVDGHEYVDLLGEYSAGLYGHSNPTIVAAINMALEEGISPGAHNRHEVLLAEVLCRRFPTIEQVRFTNSGTEANLMALSAARAYTGRDKVMVFRGGYHGSLLTFKAGASPVNAPYDFVVGNYNDIQGTRELLIEHADSLACVLVEPMLGAGGCIPGEYEFLKELRDQTNAIGALLIFDEVMTSRTGRGGLQPRVNVEADLTTLGKFIGGGCSFGAFGGRVEIMELFDPGRRDPLPHAGTFNNNVLSMAAGYAGLTLVYPPDVAELHTARGDALRAELNGMLGGVNSGFTVTGVGSLMALHATDKPIYSPADLRGSDGRLAELLFLDLLAEGFYLAPRGYLALSLAISDTHLSAFVDAVRRSMVARSSLTTRASSSA